MTLFCRRVINSRRVISILWVSKLPFTLVSSYHNCSTAHGKILSVVDASLVQSPISHWSTHGKISQPFYTIKELRCTAMIYDSSYEFCYCSSCKKNSSNGRSTRFFKLLHCTETYKNVMYQCVFMASLRSNYLLNQNLFSLRQPVRKRCKIAWEVK